MPFTSFHSELLDLANGYSQQQPKWRKTYRQTADEIIQSGVTSYDDLLNRLPRTYNNASWTQSAFWLIARLKRRRITIPTLLKCLDSNDDQICLNSCLALATLGARQATTPLISLVTSDRSIDVRVIAVAALGQLRPRKAARVLISLVLNKNEAVEVRSECAEALGYIGDKGARHALRATLADGEPEVRFWSAFALYQLGDIKAIPLLKEQIKRESATIPHWGEVRKEMSRALRALVAESKGASD